VGRVGAEHGHLAAVAVTVALQDLDGRRFPGSVRSEQGEHLTPRDREVDAVHGAFRSVRFGQSANDDRVVTSHGVHYGGSAQAVRGQGR
jgi:hypothetical protein